MRGLLQRPTTERISTGWWRQSFARAARVTTKAVALSDSVQQSSRCSGVQIMRLASTSSTVMRCLYRALGLLEACRLCATFTAATCSDRVP